MSVFGEFWLGLLSAPKEIKWILLALLIIWVSHISHRGIQYLNGPVCPQCSSRKILRFRLITRSLYCDNCKYVFWWIKNKAYHQNPVKEFFELYKI